MTKHFRSRHPRYPDDSDYTTNAPSYYDDLARKNTLIQKLAEKIWEYEEALKISFEEIETVLTELLDKIGEGFNDEIADLLVQWIDDGTLDHIINETLMNKKADKTELEVLEAFLTNELDNSISSINQDIETFETEINLQFNQFKDITNDNIDQSAQNTMQEIANMGMKKNNKNKGYVYLADYEQLEGETDDQFINRVLQTIEKRETGYREGTLILESKDYLLNGSIVLGQYQTLKGAGRGTRLKMENGSMPILVLSNDGAGKAYGITVEDLSIWGSNYNVGIKTDSATHLVIRNVYIYNTVIGFEAYSVWLGHFDRVTVRNYGAMGEYGFKIVPNEGQTSTSLLFSNTWVKNFKRGYDIDVALYSVFNATACDTFTHFAYSGGSAATFNGVGAEDGNLVDGGCVFRTGARPVVFNTPNIMNIKHAGNGEAYIFDFIGSYAHVFGFRWQSGTISESLKYANLNSSSTQVFLLGCHFPSPLEDKERFRFGHQYASVYETGYRKIRHYDSIRTNVISDLENPYP